MAIWMVTGANGNLGRGLIQHLLAQDETRVVAVVRSARAAEQVKQAVPADQQQHLSVRTLSYTDVAALRQASDGVDFVVHLVGILKQTKQARYYDAHQGSTAALVEAIADSTVQHVTYLSIVGSHPDSNNTCLASKGAAEVLLRDATTPACVLRVPMVLGQGDYASFALAKRARSGTASGFRMESLEQPIFAGDVVLAIQQAGTLLLDESLDLAGPEQLTRAELSQRAARVLGQSIKVRSYPMAVGRLMASLLELLPNPPVTRAMLDVLDHDDVVDASHAMNKLQLTSLTPLDEMLGLVLTP